MCTQSIYGTRYAAADGSGQILVHPTAIQAWGGSQSLRDKSDNPGSIRGFRQLEESVYAARLRPLYTSHLASVHLGEM